MLPTNRRINKDSFVKVMKEGVFLHSDGFYIKFLNRKDNSPSLFSFVVSAKTNKTSVSRHLVKRKMSAVVENLILKVKNSFSCLIFAKKDFSLEPYSKIETEIVNLLQKAGMLNEVSL